MPVDINFNDPAWRQRLASVGSSYGGSLGTTYPTGPSASPKLTGAIDQLLTPGLVPDIARQSAEVAAGRGVAGSPAADSTAVRMSEQNWLQRLGLANQLMSAQTQRDLPYQITPWQKSWLDLQMLLHGKTGGQSFPGLGGGGARGGYTGTIGSPMAPMESPYPVIDAVGGTRPDSSGIGGGITQGGYQGVFDLDSALEELGLGEDFIGDIELPQFPDDMYA